MAPFAECKNRPTFVDYDVENLLVALSSYDDSNDDDSSSSSSSSNDDFRNSTAEEQRDDGQGQQKQQILDSSSDDRSTSTETTFQDSFSNSSFASSDTSSALTTTTTRRRKSVTFDPQCSLATIPHWSSFTQQERRSMYMTSREYEYSKADARATADMLSEWGCEMRYGETSSPSTPDNLEDDDICFLGLEGHTTVGRTLRKSLRGRAARIVYENQHDDDDDEENDNETTNKKKVSNFFLSASAIAKKRNNNKRNNSNNINNMASQYAKISQSAISFAWMRALKNTDQIRDYLESK
mmetsp:Transcript_115190/g.161920  ORF Transcript_115190/g.161920 Transcript_115190/m.161920 type:complete len:296 (+) Transcript_115190:55-942(+)